MKIQYDIVVADSFDESGLWPVAKGDKQTESVEIDFEPGPVPEGLQKWQSWNMMQADRALDEWVKKNRPGKQYKIYYWWWL